MEMKNKAIIVFLLGCVVFGCSNKKSDFQLHKLYIEKRKKEVRKEEYIKMERIFFGHLFENDTVSGNKSIEN